MLAVVNMHAFSAFVISFCLVQCCVCLNWFGLSNEHLEDSPPILLCENVVLEDTNPCTGVITANTGSQSESRTDATNITTLKTNQNRNLWLNYRSRITRRRSTNHNDVFNTMLSAVKNRSLVTPNSDILHYLCFLVYPVLFSDGCNDHDDGQTGGVSEGSAGKFNEYQISMLMCSFLHITLLYAKSVIMFVIIIIRHSYTLLVSYKYVYSY